MALLPPKYELIPLKNASAQIAFLPPGASVTVTASPARGLEPTLVLAGQLAASGYDAIPHLAAHQFEDAAHVDAVLRRMRDGGITKAFVIGGDGPLLGGYPDALSLLEAIRTSAASPAEIGIAGYPEGHPAIASEVLQAALVAKAPLADYITTQLCFDAGAIRRWIESIRAAGVTLPIHLGLPGAIDPAKLLMISARIGVGASARYLRKNRGIISWLLPWRRPDAHRILAAMDCEALEIERAHLFTFNQVEATVRAWNT